MQPEGPQQQPSYPGFPVSAEGVAALHQELGRAIHRALEGDVKALGLQQRLARIGELMPQIRAQQEQMQDIQAPSNGTSGPPVAPEAPSERGEPPAIPLRPVDRPTGANVVPPPPPLEPMFNPWSADPDELVSVERNEGEAANVAGASDHDESQNSGRWPA